MRPSTKNVISPFLDFVLLGGASLILLPLIMYLFPTQTLTEWKILPLIIVGVFYLDYLVSFPHFAYSYQLMYQDFHKKITGQIDRSLQARYILAGIVVPTGMIIFFAVCYVYNITGLLKHAVNVMLLTAGWHYAKQGFGILIVASIYKKIFYTSWERRILLFNAHLLWIYAWVMFNTGSKVKSYFGISFSTLGFPLLVEQVFTALVCLSTLALLFVLIQKYRKQPGGLALNGITAYLASVYLWIILRFGLGYDTPIHPVVLLIPFMHSLQYITIVLRMKHNEVAQNSISRTAFLIFVVFGIMIGALIFDTIPAFLDKTVGYDRAIYGTTFFMFMFWIFINIHHYFIDNVIWRREGSEVKNYLFSAN